MRFPLRMRLGGGCPSESELLGQKEPWVGPQRMGLYHRDPAAATAPLWWPRMVARVPVLLGQPRTSHAQKQAWRDLLGLPCGPRAREVPLGPSPLQLSELAELGRALSMVLCGAGLALPGCLRSLSPQASSREGTFARPHWVQPVLTLDVCTACLCGWDAQHYSPPPHPVGAEPSSGGGTYGLSLSLRVA